LTVRLAVFDPPFAAAEIWTVVACETDALVRAKLPLLFPAGTTKVDGIAATADAPARMLNVTVVSDASA
jgi:hypothetical protein